MRLKRIATFLLILSGMVPDMSGQCGAAYVSSDDTVVCVPKIVRFKIHNFPPGTTFEWDLGSGYVSADSTFTRLYTVAGDYNVRVRLKYGDGSSCVIDKVGFLQAKAVPIPQYTISKDVICGYKDSFTLTDVTPLSVRRDWLINNTLYSDGPKSLKAIYDAPTGYKGFTIFMKDSFGCEGKRTFDSVAFLHDSLTVDFEADKTYGCIPKSIQFNDLTNPLSYNIVSRSWSFPGGAVPSSSTDQNPSGIQYNLTDTFDVSLTVTTSKGCSYSHSKPSYLMFADSAIISATFSNTVICANQKLNINLSGTRSSMPGVMVSPVKYWDTALTPVNRQYKFNDFGIFSVHITDTFNGCPSEKTYNNWIEVNGPVGRIHIPNGYSCLLPDTLPVFDSSYLNSGINRILQWNLYNDTFPTVSLQSGTGQPMNFILNKYGLYSVRMIIIGSNGCRDTVFRKSALQIRKIKTNFNWFPKPACPIEMVDFSNATPQGTSKALNRYRWTFYNLDGSVLKRDTLPTSRLSYPDTGKYTVKLLVFNNLGCRDSLTLTKRIEISKPIPQFIIYDSSVCFGKYARLKAKYTDSNYYWDYSHRWHFQHMDSASQRYSYSGDSVTVYLPPGMYRISYSRFSKRNTCYDTINLPNRIRVSGARYVVSINPPKVCNPATASLIGKLYNNYNFINSSIDPILTNWSHPYDTNLVSIRQPNLNPGTVYVKRPGSFSFKFRYIHPSGCNDSLYTAAIISGVKADFRPGNYACVGKKLNLTNRSDKDAVQFKWFMKDSGSGAVFYPSDTSKNAYVTFANEGVFKIGLAVAGNGSCTDTFIHTLYVNNIVASFTSEDTLNYCAPIIARVTAKHHPFIIEYRWYLGDGDSVTNNLRSFAHLYSQNTGPDGSDVKLVVRAYGCNDTLDRKGFIKVLGPIPKFRLTNNNGCEKLKVNFINESKYYNRFFLEYGDGSVLDSINFNHHVYQIFDRSLPFQKFKPMLSVIDSFGCLVQYQNDSILVLKAPEADFRVNRDTGCAALDVTFTNRTIGGVSFKWDFDGNGTIDNATFSPKHIYAPGEFNPVLIARASNGCEDTARDIVFIKAHARPNASFTMSTDTVCYNGQVSFTGRNLPSDTLIKTWLWDFGDPVNIHDTSTRKNPVFNFKKIQLSQVVLLVTDVNNCTDTFDRFVYTWDTIGPVSSPIHYVSVSDNRDIDVSWGKTKFGKFNSYNLYNDNSNNYTLLYSSTNRNDTNFKVLSTSGVNVQTFRYCYVIRTRDVCLNQGVVTFPHCTIYLQIDNDSANELSLNWLPYEGWGQGNVLRYRIFRSENGGPFVLYDSVVGSQTSYRNKMLCTRSYCYFVEAQQKNGKWKSRSNTVCKTPKYLPPAFAVDPIRTTVMDDGRTFTQWNPYKSVRNVRHYIISRAYNGAGEDDFYAVTDTNGMIDNDPFLNTSGVSYTYKIRAVDHCGAESPKSPENKTILLSGKSEGYVAKLKWSEYRKWASGVKQYEVLLRDDTSFKVVATFDTALSNYAFDFVDERMDDSICFRIRAVKDTSILVESFSNLLCLISDAKVWVPSAFSPNKDDHNEVFKPQAILIFNRTGNPIMDFRMEIFNRWGEKVFETDDVNHGWDGTFMGKPCQEGHYIYKMRALSLDGITSFNLEGVVTLLR